MLALLDAFLGNRESKLFQSRRLFPLALGKSSNEGPSRVLRLLVLLLLLFFLGLTDLGSGQGLGLDGLLAESGVATVCCLGTFVARY